LKSSARQPYFQNRTKAAIRSTILIIGIGRIEQFSGTLIKRCEAAAGKIIVHFIPDRIQCLESVLRRAPENKEGRIVFDLRLPFRVRLYPGKKPYE